MNPASPQEVDDLDPTPNRSGQRVGAYRLLSRLGKGGMGDVYLAARDDAAFDQRVAIKLVHEEFFGVLTRGRLRAERQMLARLEHPHIARVIDGGTSPDGAPYFVMEYVDGTPIDAYCDRERLDLRARIGLFRDVCAAVHCAHQNLIVHRDLKPSNILVTAERVPKLLDFGIAKLLDATRASHTVAVTQASVRLMTPNYASPEQAAGAAITTATDVYALGLLLYELLTGRPALAVGNLSLREIERVLTTTTPAPPSAVVWNRETRADDQERGLAEARAVGRGTTPVRLCRALRGDLDVIVLKALQTDPTRRYASVEQFAADLEYYLQGRPIVAQRDHWAYRARKFVGRYRAPVAAAASLVVLLAAFAIVTSVQAGRIARERDRVEMEKTRATTVASFLVDLFELSDPGRSRGATVTAREILAVGARRVSTGLDDQPATQATLLETIGRVYGNLGLYAEAEQAARQLLALRTKLGGLGNAEAVSALSLLGTVLLEQGNYRSAEAVLAEGLGIQQSLEPKGSAAEANLVHTLGRVRQVEGRYDEAERLYQASLDAYLRTSGPDTAAVSWVLNDLAQIRERQSDLAGAIGMTREALAMDRRLLGEDHPRVGIQLHNLAYYLYEQGDYAAAGPLLEESLALLNRVLGDRHPDTVRVLGSYGRYLQKIGRRAEAEATLRDALDRHIEVRGSDDVEVGYDRILLALLHEETGDYAAAEAGLREARRVFEVQLSADHQYVASALTVLGRVLAETGRSGEAVPLLRRALGIWQAQLPAAHPQIAVAQAALGFALGSAEGRGLLVASVPRLREAYGADSFLTRRAGEWLIAGAR